MQQKKRPLVWIMLVTMVFSLFPQGLFGGSVASAADSFTTYFTPSDRTIRESSRLSLVSNKGEFITRDNVYKSPTSSLTITGTFAMVNGTSLKVKVEQLNLAQTGAVQEWKVDETRTTTTAITDNGNNRFTANSVGLFSGFNKVTFIGTQGQSTVESSDTFYVLYDPAPFIENFTLFTDPSAEGGSVAYNLNEGTETVVDTERVDFQGNVKNATQVIVSVNGKDDIDTPVRPDGSFFAAQMKLLPGKNILKFKIVSEANQIETERVVYYFDKTKPFVQLNVNIGSETKSVLSRSEPATFTDPDKTTATLSGEVLIPYEEGSNNFATDGKVTIQPGGKTTFDDYDVTVTEEKLITGPDGKSVKYRMVKFQGVPTYDLTPDGSIIAKNQILKVNVTQGTFSAEYAANYVYSSDAQDITNIYYLPNYKGGVIDSKVPINGTMLQDDEVFILVESSRPITKTLKAVYLPSGANELDITEYTGTPAASGLESNQKVYVIKKLASGKQQIRFSFGTNVSPELSKVVELTYATISSIYVESLQNGRTYTFDSSKGTQNLTLKGELLGFKSLTDLKAELIVNGQLKATTDVSMVKDPVLAFPKTKDFNFSLPIQRNGPIYYGENTIEIRAIEEDAGGLPRTISTILKINVVDTNNSTISTFMPTLIPKDSRSVFDKNTVSTYSEDELTKIFAVTPDFVFKDNKYVTSEKEYDLVFRGSGAQNINVTSGSKVIFSKTVNTTPVLDIINSGSVGGETTGSDFAGNEDQFIARIRGLKFDAPGTQVYTLELINSTGARSTQRIEIVREPASYRIVAPQPTVGNQIVVNKNFIRFDIEAEGATEVLIGKEAAVKRPDYNNRFILDYVGLKADKENKIKISITRAGGTTNDTVTVYYTSAVTTDSQYMAPKVANKYTVFNKELTLSFPKGTVLQSENSIGITKFYPNNKLLFGIAEPAKGIVERINDYGNSIGVDSDERGTNVQKTPIQVSPTISGNFASTLSTGDFALISDIYWINGGLGELGNKSDNGYKPGTNGLAPYSVEGTFTNYAAERILTPSQRGTLTLNYDPSIVDDVGSTITVYKYSDKTNPGNWVSIGGKVDTKKHTITVPFNEFGYYKVMKQSRSYSDITNHPWARNVLNAMYSKGLMKPLKSNSFGADDQTTRGEFATLLVKGMDIPLINPTKQTFSDVGKGTGAEIWSYEAIETAARVGIVQGRSDGFFQPQLPVSREEAAVMIARAMNAKLAANDSKLSSALGKSFLDSSSIEYYARPAVQAVTKAKIMEGSPVTVPGAKKPSYQFNPKGNMTRAEAAKIAVELLKKSTGLFPKTLS
ncbi:S-layer homology domain-containing protein [Paenibacillus sp. CFBP 13594]|uniref:S-layer homology domain-containing protein n=1 Tax=Paenibacillus sp. CFBP 13594 TaxID=2774037 RepID=UPI00177AC3A6|nr:S-layer homology domain-containing protein [Paenibacillus sp. CFBP 13594]MBD8840663.1 S-layer homology domain-containing protein [Paenibacillus sp. CFBP 13594]